MRTLLVLTIKDIRRRAAQPLGFLLNLALPLALAGMLALVFGGDDGPTPRMRLVVVDRDNGFVSQSIKGASQNEEASPYLQILPAADRAEGLQRLQDEDATAMLVIPEKFGDDLLAGRKVKLELVKNPAQQVMPIVAQQGAEVLALYLSAGIKALGSQAPRVRRLLEGKGWDDAAGIADTATWVYDRVQASGDLLFPPLIEIASEEEQSPAAAGFDPIGWMYPGMIIMGLLFAGTTQMRDLLEEQSRGTLRRMLAAPLGAGRILVSKILGVALVVGLAQILFIVLGWLAFGITWSDPLALIVASLAIVIAVTGFAAMIYAVARTQRQGDAFGGILIMLMSMLGGAFMPPEILPGWLQRFSTVTLSYWGNEALRALQAGDGLRQVAPQLAALAAIGASFTAAGIVLLRFRHIRGTV
ncbi:MAG: ABC transporter permease [Acidobacteriota bacterium]